MSNFFGDILDLLDGDEWEEKPVQIEEFVQSEKYLGLPPLSENQYRVIKASSQIYKRESLHKLYGFEEGENRWKQTYNEVILQCGKGSGKDYVSTISCAYIVYLLLCLKDPAVYYGKPPGDSIDIINIAINATQAERTFFAGFKSRIEKSPWFTAKFETRRGEMCFKKNVNVYSGHSEREAWEGFNFLFVVLDEISGFALESTSGSAQAVTAQAIYDMYTQSVRSRFSEFGKVCLLSFPRFKKDFIQQRYDDVVAEKSIVTRKHTFKIDDDLPDGTEGNEFAIEWDEDNIISYAYPRIFALKRPTWEMNPIAPLEGFKLGFLQSPIDSLSRFACMPPDAVDAFFKDRQKVETAFSKTNGVDAEGRFYESFQPIPNIKYFIHVDLARVHDRAAVAMAHVSGWERKQFGNITTEPAPLIVIDCLRYWTPTKDRDVDFTEIREFILDLRRRGFEIQLVTFDRWESADTMKYLSSQGLQAERLSVAKKHYDDFVVAVHEERVVGPDEDILIEELLQLQLLKNDKVDHPRKGGKDTADAVCGAIYNAVSRTPLDLGDIEVKTIKSISRPVANVVESHNLIKPPKKRAMPTDLSDYLETINVI